MSVTGHHNRHSNGGPRVAGGCYDLSDPYSFRHPRLAGAGAVASPAQPRDCAGSAASTDGVSQQVHPSYQHSLSTLSAQQQQQSASASSSLDAHRQPITLSTSFRASQTLMSPSRHHSGASSGDDQFDPMEVTGDNGRFVSGRRTLCESENAPLLGSRVVRPEHAQRSYSYPAPLGASSVGSRWNGRRLKQESLPSAASSSSSRAGNTMAVNSANGCYGSLAEIEPLVVPEPNQRAMRSDSSFSAMVRPRRQKCQTCGGSGHLRKDNANELVALVPYRDQRLKPNRTKCYVSLAVLFTVVSIGVAVFFLYPRHVTTNTCARTRSILETSPTAMDVDLELHFNVTNHNFFSIRLDNMSVTMRQVDQSLGTTTIRFLKNSVLDSQDTVMLKHKVNGSFSGQQGRHAVEQCRQNASQNFFLTLRIELTTAYLGISTQTDIIVPHFFSCLPNTTYFAAQEVRGPDAGQSMRFVPAQSTPGASSWLRASPWRWASPLVGGREVYKNSCDSRRRVLPINRTLRGHRDTLF